MALLLRMLDPATGGWTDLPAGFKVQNSTPPGRRPRQPGAHRPAQSEEDDSPERCADCDHLLDSCRCEWCDRCDEHYDDCNCCGECENTNDDCTCCHECGRTRERCRCERCGHCDEKTRDCECDHCGWCSAHVDDCECRFCSSCSEKTPEECTCERCDDCHELAEECDCHHYDPDGNETTAPAEAAASLPATICRVCLRARGMEEGQCGGHEVVMPP